DGAVVVGDSPAVAFHPADGAVGPDDPMLDVVAASGLDGDIDRVDHALGVVGVEARPELLQRAPEGAQLEAEDLLSPRVPRDRTGRQVPVPRAQLGGGQRHVEVVSATPNVVLRRLPAPEHRRGYDGRGVEAPALPAYGWAAATI